MRTPRSWRLPRLVTGAALSAAVFGLAAPAVSAGDFGEVEATPQPARAGARVSLATRDCGRSRSATIDASALGGGTLTLRPAGDGGALVGELSLRPDTRPGNYGIGGSCADGKDLTGMVSAARGGGGEQPGPAGAGPDESAEHAATRPGPKPRGGMRTGAGTPAERPGTTEVLLGTALMLAAAGGGTWVLRRRHRRGGN
ncbi:hypothetical protein [Streptomyces gilvosporeus]|uniref:Gram-positive cocci surface proteins LPxTG domain-containing protein n=1 Tax=Streptomyces gilvosporeus TaxID=553510 RepID=A0A1V0TPM4_9ACTN|nr:hypothetical protein [Streptomyces gilvosporeus]ARF54748.1 hypothetical protein B1H19_11470 [Streptomyces gilvosporeus]